MIYTTCAMFSVVKFPNLLHISIFVGMHKLDRANFLEHWQICRFERTRAILKVLSILAVKKITLYHLLWFAMKRCGWPKYYFFFVVSTASKPLIASLHSIGLLYISQNFVLLQQHQLGHSLTCCSWETDSNCWESSQPWTNLRESWEALLDYSEGSAV